MLNKIKSILLSINFIVVMFICLTMRSVVLGAGIGDAIALLGICSLYGFNLWLNGNHKDELLETKVQKELDELKVSLTGMQIKNSVKPQPGIPPRFF